MKRNINLFLLTGLCPFLFFQAHAEENDSVKVKKSGLVAGLKYLSNNIYLGRIDSANIMYLVPSIGYAHKSGFHIGASLSYQLDAGINKIDASALEGGYDFKIGEKQIRKGSYFKSLYIAGGSDLYISLKHFL